MVMAFKKWYDKNAQNQASMKKGAHNYAVY